LGARGSSLDERALVSVLPCTDGEALRMGFLALVTAGIFVAGWAFGRRGL
jgi:hypothetical protein